jgi:hypothetical protein
MKVFCFYLMMEIVVESSSITEIPSALPPFHNMVPCCFFHILFSYSFVLAIKILLEYIDQPEIRRKIEQLTIFSDSQTAIGKLKTITELHSNF